MGDMLRSICSDFIRENNITCAEKIYQSDTVIQNAYEFIEMICDEVGYVDYNDD